MAVSPFETEKLPLCFQKVSNAIMFDAAISSNVGKGKKDLHFDTRIVIIKLCKIRTNICFYV